MSVLAKICADKAVHVAAQKQRISITELEARAKVQIAPRGFINAIKTKNAQNQAAIIAEVKKASPSKGLIATDFDPVATAKAYQDKGAACVSVLTDTPYFQGTDDDFNAARAAITLPMIRKDFMVDPYQIIESRAMGADCILIIMAALDDSLAKELTDTARAYDLDILFETHNAEEIERCLKLNPEMVGINSRNLKTLDVDINMFDVLYDTLPADTIKIAESGIQKSATIEALYKKGYNGFLIGESFMRGMIDLTEL